MTTKENTRTIKVKCTLYIPVVVPNDPDLDWELCIEERGCPGTGRVGDAIKEYIEKCEKEGVCWGCPGRNEIMEAAECAPVQPAPAEKEEEWWMRYDAVEAIVKEAKRRGAEEAWRELESYCGEQRLSKDRDSKEYDKEGKTNLARQMDGERVAYWLMQKEAQAKLESLNKPAGAGEK